MLFFGEPWDAPVIDDAQETVTPVGEPCMHCEEPIVMGDRGFLLSGMFSEGNVLVSRFQAIHRECMLRMSLGPVSHLEKRCMCYGGQEHDEEFPTRREAAIATWHWVEVYGGVPE